MPRPTARILIVDDEVPLMKALGDTLKDHNYETVGFPSPKDALAALHTAKFDLLLADLMMPEMSGIELLQAAQELDPDLVGIIMTGQGTIATAVEALKVGALDYILKPFKISVILPVLGRALAVRRLRMENAELQRRVNERTAELEAANKELDSFAHSVSHDLRAPLRAVGGFSNVLLEDFAPQMPAKAQDLLHSVIESVKRMGELVEDLLRFSRLSRQLLSKGPVNVSALVGGVLAELRKQEGDRDIEVHVEGLPECQADAALLRQVFINLLSNAFKFTRQKDHAIVEVPGRQFSLFGGTSV